MDVQVRGYTAAVTTSPTLYRTPTYLHLNIWLPTAVGIPKWHDEKTWRHRQTVLFHRKLKDSANSLRAPHPKLKIYALISCLFSSMNHVQLVYIGADIYTPAMFRSLFVIYPQPLHVPREISQINSSQQVHKIIHLLAMVYTRGREPGGTGRLEPPTL